MARFKKANGSRVRPCCASAIAESPAIAQNNRTIFIAVLTCFFIGSPSKWRHGALPCFAPPLGCSWWFASNARQRDDFPLPLPGLGYFALLHTSRPNQKDMLRPASVCRVL